ncbi:MAG: rRNA maturation RNase YbeY [Bdellovibrionota bacterium]
MDDPSHLIHIENNSLQYTVSNRKIEQIIFVACQALHVDGHEVSIQFIDEPQIQELNEQYRQINRPTDVLSFPQVDWKSPLMANIENIKKSEIGRSKFVKKDHSPIEVLGDIVICPSMALNNAIQINQSLDKEVCFLLIHGLLHLCGHDHEMENDEILMLDQQKKIMQLLNEYSTNDTSPKPIWQNCIQQKEARNV